MDIINMVEYRDGKICLEKLEIKDIVDIKALQELGVEIAVESSTQKRYYMIGRRFDLPELKTMIDAIESARFIPKEKSAALVKRIGSLTSCHNTEKLVRNVDVENRIKADNEKVYYIMEALNEAINSRKTVSFQYFTFNVRRRRGRRAVYQAGGRRCDQIQRRPYPAVARSLVGCQ